MQLDKQPQAEIDRRKTTARRRRNKTNAIIVLAAMVAKGISEIWHTSAFQAFLWDVLRRIFCPPCK